MPRDRAHGAVGPIWGLQGDAGGGFKAAEMQDATRRGTPTRLDAGPSAGRLSTHGRLGSFVPKQLSRAKMVWQIEPKFGLV